MSLPGHLNFKSTQIIIKLKIFLLHSSSVFLEPPFNLGASFWELICLMKKALRDAQYFPQFHFSFSSIVQENWGLPAVFEILPALICGFGIRGNVSFFTFLCFLLSTV